MYSERLTAAMAAANTASAISGSSPVNVNVYLLGSVLAVPEPPSLVVKSIPFVIPKTQFKPFWSLTIIDSLFCANKRITFLFATSRLGITKVIT